MKTIKLFLRLTYEEYLVKQDETVTKVYLIRNAFKRLLLVFLLSMMLRNALIT